MEIKRRETAEIKSDPEKAETEQKRKIMAPNINKRFILKIGKGANGKNLEQFKRKVIESKQKETQGMPEKSLSSAAELKSERFSEARKALSFFGDSVTEIPRERLSTEEIKSFQNSEYYSAVSKENIILYRIFGGGATKEGNPLNPNIYLTPTRPDDRLYEKLNLALTNYYPIFPPEKGDGETKEDRSKEPDSKKESGSFLEVRNNSREYYCEVFVPKGTVMSIGITASQRTKGGQRLPGGGIQVILNKHMVKLGEQKVIRGPQGYHSFEQVAAKHEKKRR